MQGPDGKTFATGDPAAASPAVPGWAGPRGWAILLGVASAARLIGLGHKQLWVDEIIQALHAIPDTLAGVLEAARIDCGSAPLDYLVQHFTLRNLPLPLEWAARLHAALFGIAGVLLLDALGRRLLGPRAGRLAALLFAVYPLHQHYSQEGRFYALFTAAVLLSFLALERWDRHPTAPRWLAFAGTAVLGVYTHPYMMFVLAAQFVATLPGPGTSHRGDGRPGWGRPAAVAGAGALSAVAYLPWLVYGYAFARGGSPPALSPDLVEEVVKGLGAGSYPLAALIFGFAALGVVSLGRPGTSGVRRLLLAWVLVPLPLILAALWARSYFFATRQLLFVTPALYLLAADGIFEAARRWGPRWRAVRVTVLAGLLAAVSLVVVGLHYPDRRDDLRGAAAYLSRTLGPTDVLYAPRAGYLLAFYQPALDRARRDWDGSVPRPAAKSRVAVLDFEDRRETAGIEQALEEAGWSGRPIPFRGLALRVYARP
ncbi:MAG: glycosyltransferase family 39 protein [Acidobacteria bacterium]|nr:glycosyltransferase family 39 protein [Acidobacteriota bacterium]